MQFVILELVKDGLGYETICVYANPVPSCFGDKTEGATTKIYELS